MCPCGNAQEALEKSSLSSHTPASCSARMPQVSYTPRSAPRVNGPPGLSATMAVPPACMTSSQTARTTSGCVVVARSGARRISRLTLTSTRMPGRTNASMPPSGASASCTARPTTSRA